MKLDIRGAVMPDLGLLLMRLMLAAVGIYHGGQKLFGVFGGGGPAGTAAGFEAMGFPVPMLSGLAIGIIEFFGGILVGVGLFTRIAVIPWAVGMLVASFWVHGHAFGAQEGGMEYPLTLAVFLIGLFFTGPGRYSVSGPARK
jgi:putative oxidoreductase